MKIRRQSLSKILGFSTLETIISLGLLTPCLIASLILLRHSLSSYIKTSSLASGQRSVIKLKQYLSSTFIDYDSHRYALSARIHNQGLITFTNGITNPLSNISGLKKPDPNSDAISFGIIRGELTQTVQLVKGVEAPLALLTCPTRNDNNQSLSKYKSFLGISVEGIYELSGSAKLWKKVNQSRCWIITVKHGPSNWIYQPDHTLATNIFKIIPIEALFTIYLNQANELRYVSHRLEANIENQPLATDILKLRFNLSEFLGLTYLTTVITPKHGPEYKFTINNYVSRHKLLALLLNNP